MALILVVDDDDAFRASLRRILEGDGHEVLEAADPVDARVLIASSPIAVLLCDITMPGGSGLDLARFVRSEWPDIAVVMVTGIDDIRIAGQALELGAYGYLVKPTRRNELLINLASALRRRELEIERDRLMDEMEAKLVKRGLALRESLKELERSQANAREAERLAVNGLVTALTLRSEETGGHMRRMGSYCAVLARRRGLQLWDEDEMFMAGMLHDVGKVAVPDAVLLKPGRLTDDEYEIVKRHCHAGHALLSDSESKVVLLGARIALTHHERWDGNGYPRELAREAIPLEGRIAAVADVFDALTSARVYKPAMPFDRAADILRSERERHFDPELVDLFLDNLDEIWQIRAANPDQALSPAEDVG